LRVLTIGTSFRQIRLFEQIMRLMTAVHNGRRNIKTVGNARHLKLNAEVLEKYDLQPIFSDQDK
jgi:hypothetical protein